MNSLLLGSLLCGFYLVAAQEPSASFPKIYTASDAVLALNDVDHQSLVVFDVDNVLLMPQDPFEIGFHDERRQHDTIHTLLKDKNCFAKIYDYDTRLTWYSIFFKTNKSTAVHAKMSRLIAMLQSKKVTVVALTDYVTGRYGEIESLEQLRIEQLRNVGIDFSDSFPSEPHYFYEINAKKPPLFWKGILFTNHACQKKILLNRFMHLQQLSPSKVYMFEDREDELFKMLLFLRTLNIPFFGNHCLGHAKKKGYFDPAVALYQLQHLVAYSEWIDGQKAQMIMRR